VIPLKENLMRRTLKRALALATTAVVAATPVFLVPAPAQAGGPERHAHGTVAGARYEMSAEKDNGRFEVDADLDGVAAGSRWKMVVRHYGTTVATRTADAVRDDGRFDVDFPEVRRPDTRGKDVFKVTLTRTDGAGKVTRTLRFPV
jgi:hypothetical protein